MVVLANELLDNLAFGLGELTEHGWCEVLVGTAVAVAGSLNSAAVVGRGPLTGRFAWQAATKAARATAPQIGQSRRAALAGPGLGFVMGTRSFACPRG